MPTLPPQKALRVIGTSRGLGLASIDDYTKHGWDAVAIERENIITSRHTFAEESNGRLEFAAVDSRYAAARRPQSVMPHAPQGGRVC